MLRNLYQEQDSIAGFLSLILLECDEQTLELHVQAIPKHSAMPSSGILMQKQTIKTS